MEGLWTTAEAAVELGISSRRVRALARRLGLGWRHGRDLILRDADIVRMKRRRPRAGRPPKADQIP